MISRRVEVNKFAYFILEVKFGDDHIPQPIETTQTCICEQNPQISLTLRYVKIKQIFFASLYSNLNKMVSGIFISS